MPEDPMAASALGTGATLANVAAAFLAVLGTVLGVGALVTAGVWIALAAAAVCILLAAAFVLAGRWLRSRRRAGVIVLVFLTLLLGFGTIRGDFMMLLPLIPSAAAAFIGLRAWRSLGGTSTRDAAHAN